MRLRRISVSLLALGIVAMLLPTSASAQSGFRLRVEDQTTGQGVVITDSDLNGALSVTMISPGGKISFSLTEGLASAHAPSGGGITPAAGVLAELFLKSITMTTTGAASVKLTLEDRGFTSDGAMQLTTHIFDENPAVPGLRAPVGSTLSSQSWVDVTNDVPNLGANQAFGSLLSNPMGPIPLTSTITTPPLAFVSTGTNMSLNQSATANFTAAGPYSLFTQVIMNFTNAGAITFNQEMTVRVAPDEIPNPSPVPEPGSLVLMGTGLFGILGAVTRRRTKLPRS